jgi:hypothetical protein
MLEGQADVVCGPRLTMARMRRHLAAVSGALLMMTGSAGAQTTATKSPTITAVGRANRLGIGWTCTDDGQLRVLAKWRGSTFGFVQYRFPPNATTMTPDGRPGRGQLVLSGADATVFTTEARRHATVELRVEMFTGGPLSGGETTTVTDTIPLRDVAWQKLPCK